MLDTESQIGNALLQHILDNPEEKDPVNIYNNWAQNNNNNYGIQNFDKAQIAYPQIIALLSTPIKDLVTINNIENKYGVARGSIENERMVKNYE